MQETLLDFARREIGEAGKNLEFALTEKIDGSNIRKPVVLHRTLSQQVAKRVIDLTKYSPEIIAQQLTLIDSNTFREIETKEIASWDSAHVRQHNSDV